MNKKVVIGTAAGILVAVPNAAAMPWLTRHEARRAARNTLATNARDIKVDRCKRLSSAAISCRVSARLPMLVTTVTYGSGQLSGSATVDPSTYTPIHYTVIARLYQSGRVGTWSPFLGWLPSIRLAKKG